MATLANSRHERFCQAVASGKTATEAYSLAGYAADDGHAARLAGNGRIKARIAEILSTGAEEVEMGIAEAARYLWDVMYTPVGDVDESSYLAQEMRKTRRVEGRGKDAEEWEVEYIKIPSKLEAWALLAKCKGWFAADKIEVTGNPLTAAIARIRRRKSPK